MDRATYYVLLLAGLSALGYGLYELDEPAVTAALGLVLALLALASAQDTTP